MAQVQSMLNFFNKNYEELKDDNYGWYNTDHILTREEIDAIYRWCLRHPKIKHLIIINGVNPLRPQRSYGGLPQWVRNNTAFHYIKHWDNCFVFISSVEMNDEDTIQDMRMLLGDVLNVADISNAQLILKNAKDIQSTSRIKNKGTATKIKKEEIVPITPTKEYVLTQSEKILKKL